MRPEYSLDNDDEAAKRLINYGYYKPVKSAEYHANSADLARLLHNAIGLDKTMFGKKREEQVSERSE